MQKARVHFSPLEHAYNEEFGQYPDYHFTNLRKKFSRETTAQIIQKNMDYIWEKEKEKNGYIKDGFFAVTEQNKEKIPF